MGVVGGCDVAYMGCFSGDVAYMGCFSGDMAVGGCHWQRATWRELGAVTWKVICPHPSMRGGANAGGCRRMVVGTGDAVQWAGVGVNDEHAVTWPMRAFARSSSDGGSGGGMWVGRGEKTSSDGTMFGNRWLPNIAIIINQRFNY